VNMDASTHLAWLGSRRSLRRFEPRPVSRDVLERLFQGAITAPSATNRQPWRFAAVTAPAKRAAIVEAVRARTNEMKAVIARSHHAEDFGSYGDFFYEPIESAQAIVIPQYRPYPDMIANLIQSGGGDPSHYDTAAAMQSELCSTCAAIMCLLLQAHAEGLGACWMAGPMVARRDIEKLLDIESPWRMVGAVALGYPEAPPADRPGRKPIDKVVTWYGENDG
jgi:nitroreductase